MTTDYVPTTEEFAAHREHSLSTSAPWDDCPLCWLGSSPDATVFLEDVFDFLDDLRKSGLTNMLGAAPYVTNEFDLPDRTARALLAEWMRTFGERHPVLD